MVFFLLFFTSSSLAVKPFKIDSLTTHQVWLASHVIPGSGQVINKQYWKAPLFIAGMSSFTYFGIQANQQYLKLNNEFKSGIYYYDGVLWYQEKIAEKKLERNLFFAGAATFYLASIADALVVHSSSKGKHSPVTATILSTLVPGLGQAYNQKIWKIPVIYGAFASLYYIVDFNNRNYIRLRTAYEQAVDPNQTDEFGGRFTPDYLKYYRDAYRRNRDLAVISLVGLYLLNIIDANVDAHFFYWDISDNLALNFIPTLSNEKRLFVNGKGSTLGVTLNLTF